MKLSKEAPAFEFDESSDLPLWVQLRNRMAYLINSGFYKPGDKLPTVRKYAADLRIAYNTVRGSGVFVNDPEKIRKASGQVDALVEDFVKSCLKEGMAYEDVPKLVSACVRRMKREHEKQK